MIRKLILLAPLALFSLSTVTGARGEEVVEHDRAYYAQNTQSHVYTNDAGQSLPYRLFVPHSDDAGTKYPLLLSLHGAGSRGTDNLVHLRPWVAGWITDQVQKEHPCIIVMPQCPGGQQWVNTPWRRGSYSSEKLPISESMKLAKAILDKVLREEAVDTSRIYVMGASMGGYGTWGFVTNYPELVAAAVPICGGGDPAKAAAIAHIPIWAFHGDQDNVVPPSGSHDMDDAIKKAGGKDVRLTVYEGVRHESYTRAWKEKELIDWLFAHRKMGGEGTEATD
jgi:predicted peptidase